MIGRLVKAVEQFEVGWNTWFTQQRITPFEVTYEQLASDPLLVAHQVLDFLDLDIEEGREFVVRDRQQADQVNAHWIEKFKSR
ncbi:MAG TPA: Stf0 family sulfotransferase [Microlunatus sp.]|nr:Stf0 family sulfotransferase [Microlunatus sp.]